MAASLASHPGSSAVSIIIFWGMVEIGVAMLTSCLSTLRLIIQGWPHTSVIASIRFAIALRPKGSREKTYSRNNVEASESETAIANIPQPAKLGLRDMDSIDVVAYATGKVSGEHTHGREEEKEIRRDTHIE